MTVLATMFFVSAGPFATDSGSQIEETIQQLELDGGGGERGLRS